jgi:O-antigen ligase
VIDETTRGDNASGKPDGRSCENVRSCYFGDAEPGAEYVCEHIGLFGTTSVGRGRVRYRGVLQDPNELALAGGVGLPLAFALGRVPRKSLSRRVVVALTLALVVLCAILTGSRSGQLVFLAVLAVYFLKRFGLRGLLVAGTAALPLLMLGGRSGEEATSSTTERIDCWMEALSMWRSHPLIGVGLGQFGEYHYLTAHNSYLLTLAELGLPGMLLFSIIVYISLKIPLAVLREVPATVTEPNAAESIARPWAMALLAAFAGLSVGIFFLSFAYHYVLWIYLGLAGALFSAVKAHDPSFRVRFGLRDLALVVAADVGIILTVYLYTRWALR